MNMGAGGMQIKVPLSIKAVSLIPIFFGFIPLAMSILETESGASLVLLLFFIPYLLFFNPLLMWKDVCIRGDKVKVYLFGVLHREFVCEIKGIRPSIFHTKVIVCDNEERIRFSSFAKKAEQTM